MADNSSESSDGRDKEKEEERVRVSETSQEEERARVSETSQVLWNARQNNVGALEKLLKQNPCLVDAHDYDERTSLHVAAFHGCTEAAKCLLDHGASVNAVDRWENSALADAENARHVDVVELLKSYGGKSLGNHGSHFEAKTVAPPHPHKCDWEINPAELDFTNSSLIGKGSFGEIRVVKWRGTPVAVKSVLPSLSNDKLVIQDFRHEVDLLVKLRHPNIVQFLGAVTREPPLMLITEYLSGGDLHRFLEEKGALSTLTAVNFALDIVRGMTYLHNEPCVIIHRDLKPRNILLVNENHLKVGDFGLSKLISAKFSHDMYKLTGETGSYRYMAPEVFKHRRYDEKVDVFSFAMILYEMFEGNPPFSNYDAYEAARIVSKGDRPFFRAKTYVPELKELIEECWHADSNRRPTFLNILNRLEKIKETLPHEHHWHFLHHC